MPNTEEKTLARIMFQKKIHESDGQAFWRENEQKIDKKHRI
jgi:hypothetical protein